MGPLPCAGTASCGTFPRARVQPSRAIVPQPRTGDRIEGETRAVKRTRVTLIQTLLARSARMVNMLGAFVPYRQNLNGRLVVLVGDILMTGANISYYSRACKKAGAVELGMWTFTRHLT